MPARALWTRPTQLRLLATASRFSQVLNAERPGPQVHPERACGYGMASSSDDEPLAARAWPASGPPAPGITKPAPLPQASAWRLRAACWPCLGCLPAGWSNLLRIPLAVLSAELTARLPLAVHQAGVESAGQMPEAVAVAGGEACRRPDRGAGHAGGTGGCSASASPLGPCGGSSQQRHSTTPTACWHRPGARGAGHGHSARQLAAPVVLDGAGRQTGLHCLCKQGLGGHCQQGI